MKTFKIAFVLPNGIELFYAYENCVPYLTRSFRTACNFDCKFYRTQRLQEDEAARLKRFFFGTLEIIAKVIK